MQIHIYNIVICNNNHYYPPHGYYFNSMNASKKILSIDLCNIIMFVVCRSINLFLSIDLLKYFLFQPETEHFPEILMYTSYYYPTIGTLVIRFLMVKRLKVTFLRVIHSCKSIFMYSIQIVRSDIKYFF